MSRVEPSSGDADVAIRSPSDALETYPRALVDGALDRLLASAVFRRSERHRRLMRHLVQSALEGRANRLKELLLGIELFDRRLEHYDPKTDPIVRVEVGRLREKLVRYYERDGAREDFAFAIPVGAYVPRFDRRPRAARVARPVRSYAVLPFSTAGGDDDSAFSIGLADQLIHLLGRAPDVRVVARVSAFKARERQLDVRGVGKLLDVTRVIDGSIQRQGSRVRCIAHVFDVKDGASLWSRTFDSQAQDPDGTGFDLFAFQDLVAETVMAAVAPVVELASAGDARPGGRAAPALPTGPVVSTAPVASAERRRARDLFERANYLLRRYDAAVTGKVIELLEQAVALDADHIRALLALAKAYVDQIALLNAPTLTLLPKIEAAIERALVLDPADSDALSLRASVAHRFRFDWPKAERLFLDALALAPHSVTSHYRYAGGLLFNGRFDEALAHLRIAIDLDPLHLGIRTARVPALALAREYRQAEEEAWAILEIEPDHLYVHVVLAQIHLYQRRSDDALPHLQRVIDALPAHPVAFFLRVCALGLRGDGDAGRRELDALLARFPAGPASPYFVAMARLCLGDRDAALEALDQSATMCDPMFESLPVDPLFEPLHDDAAFVALLARHGVRGPVRL